MSSYQPSNDPIAKILASVFFLFCFLGLFHSYLPSNLLPSKDDSRIEKEEIELPLISAEKVNAFAEKWCAQNGYLLQNGKKSGKYYVFLTVEYGGSMSNTNACILKIPTTGDLRIIDKSCGKLADVAYTFDVY